MSESRQVDNGEGFSTEGRFGLAVSLAKRKVATRRKLSMIIGLGAVAAQIYYMFFAANTLESLWGFLLVWLIGRTLCVAIYELPKKKALTRFLLKMPEAEDVSEREEKIWVVSEARKMMEK